MWKPFNPVLGETFEYQTDNFQFLSEQVSADPQVVANYCLGKNPEAKYVFWNNQSTSTKFTGSSLQFGQRFKTYITLEKHQETFETESPLITVNNIIIGKKYVDVEGSLKVKNL